MKIEKVTALLTSFLLLITLAYFRFDISSAISFLPIAIFVGLSPYLIWKYIRYNEIKRMEAYFPEFLRSLSEAQKSGISLPRAIINATKIDYGPLSKEIKKMAAQITWGVPFPKVLKSFSERVKDSSFLRRSIAVILEAYRSGGDIAEVMKSVADNARMVKELEAERKSRFSQQLMIMYAIFLIFLVIIVALNKILLPMFALSGTQEIAGLSLGGGSLNPSFYRTIFLHMIVIQAIFAGLLAGQVGEGSTIAGVKHSLLMLAIGSIVFTLFIPTQKIIIDVSPIYEVFPPGSTITIEGSVLTPQKIPIGDANVKITIEGRSYITKTDPLGTFSQKIILPSSKGRYKVDIEAKAKAGKGKTSLEVIVG